MCSSSKHGTIKRKCLIFYTYVFKNACMPSKNSFGKRISGFKVVFCHLTRVADATSNIKVTTILMSAHLSNTPNKKSKAYQSMDDLSTLLTPTQSSVDSAERVRTGVEPCGSKVRIRPALSWKLDQTNCPSVNFDYSLIKSKPSSPIQGPWHQPWAGVGGVIADGKWNYVCGSALDTKANSQFN